jgi:streptogramin lyase
VLGSLRVPALLTVLLLAACGGGGSSPAAPAAPAGPVGPQGSGSLTITIGNGSAATSTSARRAQFISANASSLGVEVATTSNSSPPQTFFDVSSASTHCTTASNVRTCTIPITAPVGTPTLLLALFDGANGTGHLIAEASAEPTVVSGQTFTISATMAPVVATLVPGSIVYTSGTSFIVGTAGTATVTVGADDPDSTTIPSTSTFATGISLSSSDSHIAISPSLWTSPGQPITVTYDGSAAVGATVAITFANPNAPTLPFAVVPVSLSGGFTISEFVVPTPNSESEGITSGPDGALWFVEQTGNNVARITTSGAISEFLVPTSNSAPTSIATGSDGNLWFTEENTTAPKIGQINPATHTFSEFSAGITLFSLPFDITSNPDHNQYFTEFDGNNIARITTGGVVTEFPIGGPSSNPEYIVTGPDGALWFTQPGTNQIGRMTTAGAISEFNVPTASSNPDGITVGPDSELWFVENSGNKVARLTTTGTFTEFTIPTANSHPMTITTGADGNLWFTENANAANKVARMTTAGVFTEFPVPTANSGPCSITLGPDNHIWFAENNNAGNKIGKI